MPQLLTRILSYLRRNVISFVALFFARRRRGLRARGHQQQNDPRLPEKSNAGAYVQKRCHAGQSALVWNEQGPPSPTAWASVQANGSQAARMRISVRIHLLLVRRT